MLDIIHDRAILTNRYINRFRFLVLKTFESYILDAKLMSNNIKLPVFVTFLVLILSEHFWSNYLNTYYNVLAVLLEIRTTNETLLKTDEHKDI